MFGKLPWKMLLVCALAAAVLLYLAIYTTKFGYELRVSTMAVADELAGAAEPVMGKLARVPVAIVRGFPFEPGAGTAQELIRPPERDLFR